jgi:hypothetical protein
MSLIQIPGTNLFRDTDSMALVNKDINGLEEYNLKRKLLAVQKSEINTVKLDIQNIKNEMLEIKQLLLQLMDKNING